MCSHSGGARASLTLWTFEARRKNVEQVPKGKAGCLFTPFDEDMKPNLRCTSHRHRGIPQTKRCDVGRGKTNAEGCLGSAVSAPRFGEGQCLLVGLKLRRLSVRTGPFVAARGGFLVRSEGDIDVRTRCFLKGYSRRVRHGIVACWSLWLARDVPKTFQDCLLVSRI